jgi:hypothetical protein
MLKDHSVVFFLSKLGFLKSRSEAFGREKSMATGLA